MASSTPQSVSPEVLRQNRGPNIVAGSSVCFTLATIALIARFYVRRMKSVALGPDDWLVMAAWPFGLALFVMNIFLAHWGMGRHINTIQPEDLKLIANITLATQLIWAASLSLVKISILALYNRIFGNLRHMRLANWTLSTFTIALSLVIILVSVFQCHPIQAAWAPTGGARCINYRLFFIIGSALDLAVWIILLFLPMRAVWMLQKSLIDRISLVFIFALGGLTCVISLVRLIEFVQNQANSGDITYTGVQVLIWSTAQPCLGIVCACLPTMTPLVRRFISPTRSSYSTFRGHTDTPGTKRNRSDKGSDPYGSTGNLRSPNGGQFSLRDGDYGFRVDSDPAEIGLAEAVQMHGENEVYAMTTIDVEQQRR